MFAMIETQQGVFDIKIENNTAKMANSVQSLLTTMLFTNPFWASPISGSQFQNTSSGIISSETRQNIEIEMEQLKQQLISEKIIETLDFQIHMDAKNIQLDLKWKQPNSNTLETLEVSYS